MLMTSLMMLMIWTAHGRRLIADTVQPVRHFVSRSFRQSVGSLSQMALESIFVVLNLLLNAF